jgi:ribosomal protein S18 acetylase RimI-like enzyme
MSRDFLIRSATERDINRVVAMRLRLQEHMITINRNLWQMSEKSIATLPSFYRSTLEDKRCHLVVVEDKKSGIILGMGLGRICEHDEHVPNESGKIDDIWVEPNYRKKGLCKMILSELKVFFESKGIDVAVLDFVNGNFEAETVWKRFGFQPVLTTATAKLDEIGI